MALSRICTGKSAWAFLYRGCGARLRGGLSNEKVHEPMAASGRKMREPCCDEVIAGEYVLGVLSAEERRKVEARLAQDRQFAAMVSRWEENLSTLDDEGLPLYLHPIGRHVLGVTPPDAVFSGRVAGGCWHSLTLWRALAFASLAVAAGLAFSMSALLAPRVGALEVWLTEEGKAPVSLGVLPEKGKDGLAVPAKMHERLAEGGRLSVGVRPSGVEPVAARVD